MPKKGGKKGKKSNLPDWMSDELKKVAQDVVQLCAFMSGTSDNATVTITKSQAAIFLRMFVNPTKLNAKKDEAIGQGAIETAWKMAKNDGDNNEKTIAVGLLETLTRVDGGREALAALRPWVILWGNVCNGSTALAAESLGVLTNLLQGWDQGIEIAMENKRALMRFLKELPWHPLISALRLYREMETCGGRTATVKASALLVQLLSKPLSDEAGGTKTDRDNQDRAKQQVLAAKGLPGLVALAKAQDIHTADLAARENAVACLHVLLKDAPADIHDAFIECGGVPAMVQAMKDRNKLDPEEPPLLSVLTRARAAGCLRAIMKPDMDRARMDGEARQRQYAEQLAARPTSSYTSLRPIEAYVRESDLVRPSTAYDFRGNSGGSQLGELGPASILESQMKGLMGTLRPESRLVSPPGTASYNPYARDMMASRGRSPGPRQDSRDALRPGTALGPAGQVDVTPWGTGFEESDMLGDTMRFETLMVDDALRDFALRRAELVASAGAIPYLVEMCCGPEGPLPDKEAPLAEGGAGGKKKKKKGKKQPVPPGLEDGQRYATGCLRVMALKKELREEMMGAGILRYTAALMMSKNHKARWHARNIILALASDEENRGTLELYEKKMGKKALSSKTCDGVPEFITMTNLPRRAMAHSKAPELLYGKTHRLAQTAEDIKEADARRRFGTTGKAAVKL